MKHEHTLEKIAQTRESEELPCKIQVTYSECASCGQLFETEQVKSREGKEISTKTKQYAGLLNRNQLMDYAQKYSGWITEPDEKDIYLEIPSNK